MFLLIILFFTGMKLKDIEMFYKSVLHSQHFRFSKNDGNSCWWDTANQEKLEQIVEHLSNPNTLERKKIREILIDNKIDSVLDAGCGVGTELTGYKANNMNVRYVGMDASNSLLEIAKSRHPDNEFMYGDVNKMPFANNSFEAVILKHILEHLPDYRPAVSEAVRITSKIVIINFFHKLLPFDYRRKHKDGFWENWYNKRKFKRFITDLPISSYEMFSTIGTSKQTAEIYVLYKQPNDS